MVDGLGRDAEPAGDHGGGGHERVRSDDEHVPPVQVGDRTFVPGQGNNVYIFPAVGMAIFATQAERVTDEMFILAAQAIADQVTDEHLEVGLIYPPQSHIYAASLAAATKVAEHIFERNQARVPRPDNVEAFIRSCAYRPIYPT